MPAECLSGNFVVDFKTVDSYWRALTTLTIFSSTLMTTKMANNFELTFADDDEWLDNLDKDEDYSNREVYERR